MLCENCSKQYCDDRGNSKIIYCTAYTKKTMQTNADRIRAMSDEELAVFLAEEVPHGDCYGCELDCYHVEQGKFANMCQGAWYKWLKQEGDNNG